LQNIHVYGMKALSHRMSEYRIWKYICHEKSSDGTFQRNSCGTGTECRRL